MGTLLRFLEKSCAAVTKKYWALKKEEILNSDNSCPVLFL